MFSNDRQESQVFTNFGDPSSYEEESTTMRNPACDTTCCTETNIAIANGTTKKSLRHHYHNRASSGNSLCCSLLLLLCSTWTIQHVQAWGGSGGNTGEFDEMYYGNTFTRDWLYDSKYLSFQVEGCAWGYVADSEEVGCLEDESEDGTTNWYMMANCRRPQVVFSVYAGSSSGCNSGNFVGSVSFRVFLKLLLIYDLWGVESTEKEGRIATDGSLALFRHPKP